MDFMKWISSLDELLFEVVSWLLFFPLTLWRATAGPLSAMDYAGRQLALPDDQQYDAAMSPPLFLALSLLLVYGLSAALGQSDTIVTSRHGVAGLINDEATALIVRCIVFGAFPLFAAARYIRRTGGTLNRSSLRVPFYEQCYPTAVFALGLGIGANLISLIYSPAILGGALLMIASIAYYIVTETRWFAVRLGISHLRALGAVMLGFVEGTALLILISLVLR